MKTFKDYLNDAQDYIKTWSRMGTGPTILALYQQKTMLKGGQFNVFFEDRNNVAVQGGGNIKANCQYTSSNGNGLKYFAAHIKTDKAEFLLISSPYDSYAKHSEISVYGERDDLAYGCDILKKNGSLILKFNKKPIRIPGLDKPVYVTITVKPDVLEWATKADPEADKLGYVATSGSYIKKFAEKHGIEKPENHLQWKELTVNNTGILKDL